MKKYEDVWDDSDRLTDDGEDKGKPGEAGTAVIAPDAKPDAGGKPTGDQKPAGEAKPAEEKMVPLAALEKERTGRQKAESNVTALAEHLKQFQVPATPVEKPVDSVSKIDDEAVISGKDLKDIVNGLRKDFGLEIETLKSNNAYGSAILQAQATHPDFANVININLKNVLDANPQMQRALASAAPEFRPMLSYAMGTMDPEYAKANQSTAATKEIQDKLKANALKPGSVNAAGGTGDMGSGDDNMTMSSEAFEKKMAAVLRKQE